MNEEHLALPHSIDLPQSWVEEYGKTLEPELYKIETEVVFPEHIELSYSDRLLGKTVKDGIVLEEVANDLEYGFFIIKSENLEKDITTYFLKSAQFEVGAYAIEGRHTGVPITLVGFINKIANRLDPRRVIDDRSISFTHIKNERTCHIEDIYKKFEEMKGNTLRDEMRLSHMRSIQAELEHPSKQNELIFLEKLHNEVRRKYGALRSLMELLELRSKTEHAANATGTVIDREAFHLSQNIEKNQAVSEYYQDCDLAEIDLDKGFFEDDCHVALALIDKKDNMCRTRILELDGRIAFIEAQERIKLNPGDKIYIEKIPRFSMKHHSNALNRFMNEETEGSWDQLVSLMTSPERLRLDDIKMPSFFFCEKASSGYTLNDEQKKAVAGAVSTKHTFFIQGPPGTGKTTVITETIRQLIERGERVLLTAPTHVAVDEVLRRIGNKEGILAIRLSWDDSRVHSDLRCFTESLVKKELAKKIRRPETSRAKRWQKELETNRKEARGLEEYIDLNDETIKAEDHVRKCANELSQWEQDFEKKRGSIIANITEIRRLHENLTSEYRRISKDAFELEKKYNSELQEQTFLDKLKSGFGYGRLPQIKRELANIHDKVKSYDVKLSDNQKKKEKLEKELGQIEENEPIKTEELKRELSNTSKHFNALRSRLVKAQKPIMNGQTLPIEEINERCQQLHSRSEVIESFIALERRWFEIAGMNEEKDERINQNIADDIGDYLIKSANLVCCTTTGIAGSPFIRDADFDTIIVDEASRVTDSEFLIGAIRARRWILAGDEHQLPPYVDQVDEHHLHALAALYRVDRGFSQDLESSIKDLCDIWEEDDEELHRFRTDSVQRIAEKLRNEGTWETIYKRSFEDAYRHFKGKSNDPDRDFLGALRKYLIRSLFERCIKKCHETLRQRLVEQRRMLRPIADIVSDTVYKGNFITPPDEELSRCGITPIKEIGPFRQPVIFLDTSLFGKKAAEKADGSGYGFVNDLECDLIISALLDLEEGLQGSKNGKKISVSILCFYRSQARRIRGILREHYSKAFSKLQFHLIDAIDKIQGQESDIVFISFCRAIPGYPPGPLFGQWLQDIRRLNVACTRAHRALFLVGHKETLERLRTNEEARLFYRNLFKLESEGGIDLIQTYKIRKHTIG